MTVEHQSIDELRAMFEQWKEEEKAEQQVSDYKSFKKKVFIGCFIYFLRLVAK